MQYRFIYFLLLYAALVYPAQNAIAQPASCKIKGKIIRILRHSTDTTGVCAKYPCNAQVQVLDISDCSFATSTLLKQGDIVAIHFAFTLASTAKAMPGMKTHYPGLKKGDIFTADMTQHLKVGSGAAFIIYDYTLLRKSK